MKYRISLVKLSKIIETEEHIPERVLSLHEKILKEGVWRVPVILEKRSYAIMDGHHRYNVALKMGLKRIPAILLSYDDQRVRVESWRDDVIVNKEIIKEYIAHKKKFPYKTTKHIISPQPQELEISLKLLY